MRISGEQRPEYFDFFNSVVGGEIRHLHGSRVITNLSNDGKILAVTAYSIFANQGCHISIASVDDGKVYSKEFLRACFWYPFIQCGLKRLTAVVDETNTRALDIDRRLGFVEEGRLREECNGHDGIVLGMLKRECKWLPKQE